MIDSELAANDLVASTPPHGKKYSAFLKVDCGKGRGMTHTSDHATM